MERNLILPSQELRMYPILYRQPSQSILYLSRGYKHVDKDQSQKLYRRGVKHLLSES